MAEAEVGGQGEFGTGEVDKPAQCEAEVGHDGVAAVVKLHDTPFRLGARARCHATVVDGEATVFADEADGIVRRAGWGKVDVLVFGYLTNGWLIARFALRAYFVRLTSGQ